MQRRTSIPQSEETTVAKQHALHEPSRHSAQSYEDILASDAVPSPDFYREGANPAAALEPYATSRYYDCLLYTSDAADE